VAKLTEQLDFIISNLTAAKADAAMIDNGQAGNPGKRLRKTCTDAAKTLVAMRKGVLEVRGAAKPAKPTTPAV
jgi:hypothetical protein